MSKKQSQFPITMPVYPIQDFDSPFSDAAPGLSDSELRESAYEILIGACRSSGSRPLTYIPQSEKNGVSGSGSGFGGPALGSSPSLQRSLTVTAASKVKKALGIRSGKKGSNGGETARKTVTVGELIRVQMRVTEQTDSRIRRAMLRIAAGQLGRRIESMVLPLELLHQLKSIDFPNQQEFESWQKRNLKLLEAGLLLHPLIPLNKTDPSPRKLHQIIRGSLEKPVEAGKNKESSQNLRNLAMSLAFRSSDGSPSEKCHWADGFPLNLRIYQILLDACFDIDDESIVIDEIDEVLELIKKTWTVLGINPSLHNLVFLWVLFRHYVATGQIEDDLLFAASNLLLEVEKDSKTTKDSEYSEILRSVLSSIMGFAENRLLRYHESFDTDNIESMETVAFVAVTAGKILGRGDDVARERIDIYIRSSLRTSFKEKLEKIKKGKIFPSLSILAQGISELAFTEKAIFSPVLKRWHPLAAGIAVSTLHSCYGVELKRFVSGVNELTPDAILVLTAADKLERDLVQIAVEDAVDSEDGGKSIIREMPPYEAEGLIVDLVKSWIKIRVDRVREWTDRNLQNEVWNPKANKEQFAPSAVEVLRIIDETLDAFFLLPIPMHSILLPDLIGGLDRCLQSYISKTKSGCGNRNTYIPTLPPLTRCTLGSKFRVFKKEKSHQTQRRKSQVGSTNGDPTCGVPQLCVRINTLQHIRTQLGVLEKRTAAQLHNSKSYIATKFDLSASSCIEGIQQLCEATAYKIVFRDLNPVLYDGLYVGEITGSRIEPVLPELENYLEIISRTLHDRIRTRLITDVMRASFDGFLLVLLAGGPSRGFSVNDSGIIEEDFRFLKDLFWSNGDGLPSELIDKCSVIVDRVLPLFRTETEVLIERFRSVVLGSDGKFTRLPLPLTSGRWDPAEGNTILRVLCYRSDEVAVRFLKKTYDLPKKV